ncbi:hypothetical protein Scep_025864 [Stephania cephalantha]|uniref:Uncharacterized protein n=1 Tax=Stephania cephalantha TaxID=152367 RepID=A0AAP0HSU5_9MAGN
MEETPLPSLSSTLFSLSPSLTTSQSLFSFFQFLTSSSLLLSTTNNKKSPNPSSSTRNIKTSPQIQFTLKKNSKSHYSPSQRPQRMTNNNLNSSSL